MKCALCKREVDHTTKHHLVPRTRHRNKKIKKKFTKEELRKQVPVCGPCHRMIHKTLTEKELVDFNSVELLLEHDDIKKYVNWIKDKPNQKIKF